jgi:small subunit ribosomal protein S2
MPRKKKEEKKEEAKVEDIEEKRKKLLEKAKEMEKKVEEKNQGSSSPVKDKQSSSSLSSPIKEEKVEEIVGKKVEGKTLIPVDDYVKAGCYIGTKVITPDMRKYVYRRRADGIAIINTNMVDEKLREAAKFLSNYAPEDFIVVCKREAGWRAVKLFSELTGVRVFTKKYPAGITTNITLPNFFETELVFVCDPWLDKNALNDALNVKKKVMAICDTNNMTRGVEVVMPANNKSNKSLGIVFYVLSREYLKARGIDRKLPPMEDFIGEKLEDIPMKKRSKSQEEEKKKDTEKIESILRLNEPKD